MALVGSVPDQQLMEWSHLFLDMFNSISILNQE